MKDKKNYKEKKGEGLGALLIALAKAALSVFSSGKKEYMARRNRLIMVKRDVPKRVTLPNSLTFLARYKRKTRVHLPANIHLARPYKERTAPKRKRRRLRAAPAPAAQQGQETEGIFCFAKKKAKSKVARNIGKMALEQLPGVVEKLSGKVKNKRLKKIIGSENVKNLVNYSTAYGLKKLLTKNLLQ